MSYTMGRSVDVMHVKLISFQQKSPMLHRHASLCLWEPSVGQSVSKLLKHNGSQQQHTCSETLRSLEYETISDTSHA